MRGISVTFFTGAIVALCMGFYKMYAYTNFDSGDYPALSEGNVNSYVGGDAYNYIINGTYSIAFFVLFGALLIAGLLVEVLQKLKSLNTVVTNNGIVEGDENTRKVEPVNHAKFWK